MKINFPRPLVRVGKCIAIFKRKIGHRLAPGPCTKGRKQIMYDDEPWKPSRLSYHLNIKSIPRTPISMKKGLVLHTCDNDWCVNPKHLYFGTQSQNLYDTWTRNPYIRAKCSASHTGLRHSLATRRKMSLHNKRLMKGRKHSLESRIKMSIAAQKLSPQERSERSRHACIVRWKREKRRGTRS